MRHFSGGFYFVASGLAALAITVSLTAGQVTPSHRCGDCHRDIYRMWRDSTHAKAMEDPIFLDAYHDTREREGEAVSRTCLACHAPLAAITDDFEMEERVTWEGVNCDYCHSIVAVDDSTRPPRATVEINDTKHGPIPDAESPGHEVAYSPIHQQSLVCAPCHEYINGDGTPVMTTYSEWKASSAATDGTSCQNCHMELTRANVVDPRVKRSGGAEVNLHQVPGGHSLEQLHRALSVAIDPQRDGGQLNLGIRIINRGAGHAVPTGMPGRRVIMDLQVETSSGKSYSEKRVFEKTFLSAAGEAIHRDSGFFAKGVVFEADTRIKADEARQETFNFAVKEQDTAYVTLKLHYEHAPQGLDEDKVWLTFLSERRVVKPSSSPSG